MTQTTNPTSQPLADARAKTEKVQNELEVATADLSLTNDAFERHLPPEVREGDVGWALGQNAEIERKVQKATEDLEEVVELIAQAEERPA
jgi:hypothetical protein